MTDDYTIDNMLEFVDNAFSMSVSELLNMMEENRGKPVYPVLVSILNQRVEVSNNDDRYVKVMNRRRNGMANKIRNEGKKYDKYQK